MNVNTVSGIVGQQADSSAKKSLGKDEFLSLLITQLKHQDPLSPMENTEFTAQMAQFSSLEQLFNVNDNLVNLQALSASVSNTQALSLIGKEVTAEGDSVYAQNGQASTMSFNLGEAATSVRIHVLDSSGEVVRTLYRGSLSEGRHEVQWDGMADGGGIVPDGLYSYVVDAVNSRGDQVDTDTYMRGIVEAVSMDNGITYVHIGDAKMMISEISEVRQPTGN
ncbi:MAG: flagellar hook assembly protein FlgD [Nitrospinota bacterium]